MPSKYDPAAEDAFLQQRGAAPAERVQHLTEDELRRRLKEQLAGHICSWQQSGTEIFCEAGDFRHGKRIATNEMLAEPLGASPRLIKKRAQLRKDAS